MNRKSYPFKGCHLQRSMVCFKNLFFSIYLWTFVCGLQRLWRLNDRGNGWKSIRECFENEWLKKCYVEKPVHMMYCCWGGILQRHISNRCHTMVPERGSKWTQSGSKGTKGLAYLGDQVFWCLDSYNHETWIWLCSIIANSFSEESHTTV